MQSNLAKSLYLGLAALSLGAVATVSTTAQAASKAKIVSSKTLKTDATKRNVQPNGKNALYSKPGTVKGAKTVASKNTMKKLASSKKSADYFRAYYQKTTNKGSVYYKIVSMDGKYRGYIYGGKKAGTFAGGIKKASTTKSAKMPANTTVYFAKPGKSGVTWSAPKYTQYKATKSVKDTTDYANDVLTVQSAIKKSREGSTYYYVTDATNSNVNGWVYAKGVTSTKPADATFNDATDVKVNFATTDGKTVATGTLTGLTDAAGKVSTAKGTAVGASATSAANNDWGKALLVGTGYKYSRSDSVNLTALKNAKTGDTITLSVAPNAAKSTKVDFYATSGTADLSQAATPLTAYKTGTKAASDTVVFPAASDFSGIEGQTFAASDVMTYLNGASLGTLYTPNYTKAGGSTQYFTTYKLSSALNGTYGSTTKAFYVGTETAGVSPAAATTATTTTYFANSDAK
ncbi:hypothetical protein [Levilactobacillus parabrevis]|uniref:hypothetical protein n=1 Tax=Levilactobacillus parabrevis TaxID=357278 RepID=UPI0021A60A46|nr:hypothetical protein [Levilactobacillus parabrevis]MCT4486749.1 hypothetical protein [Levilactobacillus parabrevis]MCT4489661.1 hypothetical protein [Levilactobacillus parabrevis]